MEIIPILSTIILVATICTFILAIGAYILYKVRESKQQFAYQPKPAAIQAEVVAPVKPVVIMQPEVRPSQAAHTPQPREYKQTQERAPRRKVRFEERASDENKFLKYTSDGYVTPEEDLHSGEVKWR